MDSYDDYMTKVEDFEDACYKQQLEDDKQLKEDFLKLLDVIKRDGLKYIDSNLDSDFEELDNDIAILASMF